MPAVAESRATGVPTGGELFVNGPVGEFEDGGEAFAIEFVFPHDLERVFERLRRANRPSRIVGALYELVEMVLTDEDRERWSTRATGARSSRPKSRHANSGG